MSESVVPPALVDEVEVLNDELAGAVHPHGVMLVPGTSIDVEACDVAAVGVTRAADELVVAAARQLTVNSLKTTGRQELSRQQAGRSFRVGARSLLLRLQPPSL